MRPSLSPNEKEQFIDKSDLVIQLIRSSGIEGLSAFGGSSKQVENNLYLTKAFAYAPQPSGFLWQTFTKAPHRFAALDFLPANTEAFGLYDVNLLALWQALLKDLATSRIQEVAIALNEFARQVHSNTGMTVDELLGSLGDEAGFVITLNQDVKVTIPLPNGMVEIPEPAGAIFWTVQDDRLFDRLDEMFATNPTTQKEDRPDLRIRVIPGAAPVEYFRPTLAKMKNYLIIASNDKLVRSFAESLAGNAPTISTVAEFKELAKDVGDSGNMAQYISKRFQQTYYKALWKYMLASGSAKDAAVLEWEKTLYDLLKDWAAYGVAVREADGLYFVKKETKISMSFLASCSRGPLIYCLTRKPGSQTASSNDVQPAKKKPVDPATLDADSTQSAENCRCEGKSAKGAPSAQDSTAGSDGSGKVPSGLGGISRWRNLRNWSDRRISLCNGSGRYCGYSGRDKNHAVGEAPRFDLLWEWRGRDALPRVRRRTSKETCGRGEGRN